MLLNLSYTILFHHSYSSLGIYFIWICIFCQQLGEICQSNSYSGICGGGIFESSRGSFFQLWWLIMCTFYIATLVSQSMSVWVHERLNAFCFVLAGPLYVWFSLQYRNGERIIATAEGTYCRNSFCAKRQKPSPRLQKIIGEGERIFPLLQEQQSHLAGLGLKIGKMR